ncbi:carbohydrate sulfotransferase 1-like [Trichomycterus rosablanca]|uniref:carbohydrate sulfotransferase 1-like n=1 Tax=Trichomycterus rosablanca TaxID=2290929 RepID=UPI002F3514C5
MKCLWKLLLLFCFLLTVQYTVIHFVQKHFSGCYLHFNTPQGLNEKDQSMKASVNDSETTKHSTAPTRRHIYIFSQTRSGSSFAGQLFNQHPDIFYLFEPLYHAQDKFSNTSKDLQTAMHGVYRDLLFNLYTCNLNSMEDYIQPEPQEHLTDSFFHKTSSRALCSQPVCHAGIIDNMTEQQIKTWCRAKCPTLNLTLASLVCQAHRHVAIKTVRIFLLKDLRILIEDPRLNVRVIQLVRDPRAILASRLAAFHDIYMGQNATDQQPDHLDLSNINKTCQDIEQSVNTGLQKPTWLKGRYLLVRYEDLALNPEAKTKEIYKFLDVDIDDKVFRWLSQNTNATGQMNDLYSTSRDAKSTTESWRQKLAFDIVKTVQTICNTTLSMLGYKMVQSVTQLRDSNYSLLEPRTF